MAQNSKPPIYRDPFSASNQPAPHRRHKNGSRAKLAKRFFEDTYAAWEEQGESALARAAFHDPMGFVSMVARLMPQKIEVSTPTDGMSDERLAQMLELAESMARLRGGDGARVIAHEPTHENGAAAVLLEGGGGGPAAAKVLGRVNTPHTLRDQIDQIAELPSNLLDATLSPPHVAELPYPVGRATPVTAAEQERRNLARLVEEDIDPSSLF